MKPRVVDACEAAIRIDSPHATTRVRKIHAASPIDRDARSRMRHQRCHAAEDDEECRQLMSSLHVRPPSLNRTPRHCLMTEVAWPPRFSYLVRHG
jgi:hypothetical protein